MTIKQIIAADPGWCSVYVEADQQTKKLSNVEIRPVACWALTDSGAVLGLVPSTGDPEANQFTAQDLALAKNGLASAELVRYSETSPIGHFRYLHISQLDNSFDNPQEAVLVDMMAIFGGLEPEAGTGRNIASGVAGATITDVPR